MCSERKFSLVEVQYPGAEYIFIPGLVKIEPRPVVIILGDEVFC